MISTVDNYIKTSYDELEKVKFNLNEKTGIEIEYNGLKYEFVVYLVDYDEDIVLFTPDMSLNSLKSLKDEYFEGCSWCDNFNHNAIFFNTLSCHDFLDMSDLTDDSHEKWYLKDIADIIREIAYNISDYDSSSIAKYSNLYFYGNHLGGFLSIVLSILIKNSTSIAIEPYFNLINSGYWKYLKNSSLKNLSDFFIEKNLYKYNIYDIIEKEQVIPNTYIFLDGASKGQWKKQNKDFLNKLNSLPYSKNENDNKIHLKIGDRIGSTKILDKTENLVSIENVINIQKRNSSFNGIALKMIGELKDNLDSYYEDYINNKISFKEFINSKNIYFNKWFNSRIDIKNIGEKENSIEFLEKNDDVDIKFPKWFKNDEGAGCNIVTANDNLKLKFKCINDGKLEIKFRGPSFNINKKRVPIYICYKDFRINDETVFSKNVLIWHNEPYTFTKNVKNNEIIELDVKINTINHFYPYIKQLINFMDIDESNISEAYDMFKNYIEYLQMLNNPLDY